MMDILLLEDAPDHIKAFRTAAYRITARAPSPSRAVGIIHERPILLYAPAHTMHRAADCPAGRLVFLESSEIPPITLGIPAHRVVEVSCPSQGDSPGLSGGCRAVETL